MKIKELIQVISLCKQQEKLVTAMKGLFSSSFISCSDNVFLLITSLGICFIWLFSIWVPDHVINTSTPHGGHRHPFSQLAHCEAPSSWNKVIIPLTWWVFFYIFWHRWTEDGWEDMQQKAQGIKPRTRAIDSANGHSEHWHCFFPVDYCLLKSQFTDFIARLSWETFPWLLCLHVVRFA